jgi:polyisoprenoid-binding protein YceI
MPTTPAHSSIQPGDYDLDPQRSAVRFRTRHMFGLGPVRGTFAIRSGALRAADPLAASTVYAEIDAASFSTGNSQRDRAVRSPRYLNAARYPVITFAAHDAVPPDPVLPDTVPNDPRPVAGDVRGTLTVRGVERPVTLAVSSAEQTGAEVAVTATMHVDRFEFGLTAQRGMTGRHLEFELSATFVARTGSGRDA